MRYELKTKLERRKGGRRKTSRRRRRRIRRRWSERSEEAKARKYRLHEMRCEVKATVRIGKRGGGGAGKCDQM